MQQLKMTGDDWKSDRERKSEARAIAARVKAARSAAKALESATTAVSAYLNACRDCADGSGDERHGMADGRLILIRDMSEYAAFLSSRYR